MQPWTIHLRCRKVTLFGSSKCAVSPKRAGGEDIHASHITPHEAADCHSSPEATGNVSYRVRVCSLISRGSACTSFEILRETSTHSHIQQVNDNLRERLVRQRQRCKSWLRTKPCVELSLE